MHWPWERLEQKVDGATKATSLLEAKIDAHEAQDDVRFGGILQAMKDHDGNVERRHVENKERADRADATQERTNVAIAELKGSYSVFTDLLPALRAGIEADQKVLYRKKRAKQITIAVGATLTFVATMIPLIQALAGVRLSIHWAG